VCTLTRAVVDKAIAEEDLERVPKRLAADVAGDFAARERTMIAEVCSERDDPLCIAGCGVNTAWYTHTNQLRATRIKWE
jgi:hypothetical protein